ncbi:hypothetical protein FB451DRAFT_1404472 [Mycena latifolia]|nr:hypothetical protein FB451DRAFT_1404472 [Mycena latifolia]
MGALETEVIRAAVRRHAPQPESVALQLGQWQLKKFMNTGPFPLLQDLAITVIFTEEEEWDVSETIDIWNLEIFSRAPRLEQIYFGRDAFPSMFPFVSTAALSKMTCESPMAVDDFLNLLELAPALTEFTCSVEPDRILYHTAVLTHTHLQTLRLTNYSSTHFLPFVRLPALQDLHLHIEVEMDSNSFLSFLTHSSA